MYKIIGADGKQYGPITADILKKWVGEGRVNGQTKVRLEGTTEWRTLAEFPELAAALPISAPAPIATDGEGLGGTPLPPDVRERDYDLDLGGCLGRAWSLLTGPRMWLVIGGVAVWILIQAGLSGLAQIPLIGLLFSLASLVIGGPLLGGVYLFVLRCLRGKPAEVGDIFDGFRYRFGQLFLGQLTVTLLIFAAILPGLLLMLAGLFPLLSHRGIEGVGIALIAVGGIFILLPVIYLSVSWVFVLPLIMDKQLDFWPAMQLSRAVVGKHWWALLLMAILIGIISFLGMLACCIGIFFTAPLVVAIAMCCYERMFSLPTNAAPPTP